MPTQAHADESSEDSPTPMPEPGRENGAADDSTTDAEANLSYEEKRDRLLDGIHQAYHDGEQAQRDANEARNEMLQQLEQLSEEARRLESRASELRGDGELDPLEDLDAFDSQQAVDEKAREYDERAQGKRSQVDDLRQDLQRDQGTTQLGRAWQQAQERAREAKKTAERREERLTLLVDWNTSAPSFATEDDLDEHVDALIETHDWEPDPGEEENG